MITQYGVVAYGRDAEGRLRILLITSRETKRWVVPRGNPIAGLSPQQSALQEAYEEAGAIGSVAPREIGAYRYAKKRRDGSVVTADVHLFEMEVARVEAEWPERLQRERRWFAPEEAADAVDEPELAELLRRFGRMRSS